MSRQYKVLTSKALKVAKINAYLIEPVCIFAGLMAFNVFAALIVQASNLLWALAAFAVGAVAYLYGFGRNDRFLKETGLEIKASLSDFKKQKRTLIGVMRPLGSQQLDDIYERALNDESLQAYIRDIRKVQGREMLVIDYKYALKQAADAKAQQEELALKQSEEAKVAISRKKIELLIMGGTKSE